MPRLRFFLILFLTVALDLTVPIPSESLTVVEEFEEVMHRARSRRIQRQAHETTVRSERAVVRREPPAQVKVPAPAPRPVVVVLVPKLPPAFAESAPSPEDH
jgi:hypothetical protein